MYVFSSKIPKITDFRMSDLWIIKDNEYSSKQYAIQDMPCKQKTQGIDC